MVNVTYDGCKSVADISNILYIHMALAGSLEWFDTDVSPPVEVVYSPGDIAWVLASTALVWIMVPGVGFFYSGLLR